jgi:heme oxygenase
MSTEEVPTNHVGGPPLYGRMMKAIHTGHSFGNSVRMVKLPLIFTDERLYAGAIGQFFWLTETLEKRLDLHKDHPMVQRVHLLELGDVASGFAKDLQQIYGPSWRAQVAEARTASTTAYCDILTAATPVELVAASFILYGALVVGGGKQTQAKVKKVFPKFDHVLFDVRCHSNPSQVHRRLAHCVSTPTAAGR